MLVPMAALAPPTTGVTSAVLPNTYRDSVELMRVAAELEARTGVARAALVMATSANRDVLREAGLLAGEALTAGPNDLVIAVSGEPSAAVDALVRARELVAGRGNSRSAAAGAGAREGPHTLAEALDELPDASLALISTPGTYATAESMKALKRGLDVFLFSDNVSIADEIELKALAVRKGRLLMGPDCGTAILDGVPLGFANAVRPGSIGLIGASGTGLQQVMCLIDRYGEGVSQVIGVGGRDLDEQVGGTMMLAALERLARDPATTVIVLVSKPPAPAVAERVLAAAARCGKPIVVNFLGAPAGAERTGLVPADTLEEAARAAVALARGEPPGGAQPLSPDLVAAAGAEATRLGSRPRRILGLYSGGTLSKEAAHLLHDLVPASGAGCEVIDLGADEFTVGRPHPMIDARLRGERILEAGGDGQTGVLLLDVVLGYGSHADPAGALLEAISGARERAARADRYLAVVASVCGTPADPQNLAAQEAKLAAAGVLLAPTNAQAARLAALVVRGAP